jgi:N-methylhydantoinase B
LEPGEWLCGTDNGGGGYGDPLERDVERVARDVRERWVSKEVAAHVYGVILDDGGAVDHAATRKQRAGLTRSPAFSPDAIRQMVTA